MEGLDGWGSPNAAALDGNGAAQEVDDLARGRARPEDLGHAGRLELVGIVLRDRPAHDDEDVLGAVRAQAVDDRGTRVMCAPERIETPTASASSWIAVSTICSGVWWRPV